MKEKIKRYFWDAIAVLLGAVVAYFMWLIMFGGQDEITDNGIYS